MESYIFLMERKSRSFLNGNSIGNIFIWGVPNEDYKEVYLIVKKRTPKSSMQQTAVIYARVSSKEQKKTGFSIDAQLKLLRDYAKEEGFRIIHKYEDDETAKKVGRSDFTKMLEFFQHEKKTKPRERACRILIVEKTDRLYRNIKDWVTLDVDELNLEIHLVKENDTLSKDSGSSAKFMHGIRVLMAKNYIDNLSEEVKKGKLEKAEQGFYPTTAPLGYLNVKRGDKHTIEPDPSAAPIIKRLFQWYATGNYSIDKVAQKAYDEGLRSKRSKNKIYKGTIHKLLQNPTYHGEFIFKGTLYEGNYEPLISKDLFDRVQTVMQQKSQHPTRQQKYEWAFQGMLTCGHCGCALTAEIKKQRYVYYHCTGNRGKCPKKYVREEHIANQFTEALRKLKLDEDVLKWVIEALKASHQDERRYHDEQIAKLQEWYKTLQKRLDGMYIRVVAE